MAFLAVLKSLCLFQNFSNCFKVFLISIEFLVVSRPFLKISFCPFKNIFGLKWLWPFKTVSVHYKPFLVVINLFYLLLNFCNLFKISLAVFKYIWPFESLWQLYSIQICSLKIFFDRPTISFSSQIVLNYFCSSQSFFEVFTISLSVLQYFWPFQKVSGHYSI